MKGIGRGLGVGLLAAAVAAGVLYKVARKTREPARRPGAAVEYADPARCAQCHASFAASFGRTGMGRSFEPAGERNLAPSDPFYHRASDRYYRLSRRGASFFLRRYQSGPAGEENVEEKQVHYVLGSGNHSRSLLHRTAGGKLIELPLAWYAENGGAWAMSPGYDRPRHDDFRRRVTYECMFCHNAYPAVPSGADASGQPPVFPAALPAGIDCQRCHGPGSAHIRAVERGAPLEAIRAAITNPARLSRERQVEVCMQCHLETTSFPLPYSIRRFERGVFSFRPGEPLAEYILHFDHAAGSDHEGKFEIVSAVYRLRKSACFEKSAMTCVTCHNPHDAPRGSSAVARYTRVCQSCHANTAEPSGHMRSGNCIACHMPKRRTEDVVRVVMTDHLIQRRRPAGDPLARLSEREERYRGEVAAYYPLDPPELYSAVAQVKQESNLRNGIERLARAIEQNRPARAEPYFELAKSYAAAAEPEKAFAAFEEALRRDPNYFPAVYEYGSALGKNGRPQQAVELLKKAAAAQPSEAGPHNDLGLVYIQLGRPAEAIQEFRSAVQLDPDFAEAWNNLGGALSDSGNRAAAEEAFRNSLRAQPDFSRAHANLAVLLAGSCDLVQAQRHFEKAIATDRAYAEGWNGLGDVFAMQKKFRQAATAYRAALQRRPDFAQARLGLGASLAALGQLAEARAHLEQAARSSVPEIAETARAELSHLKR